MDESGDEPAEELFTLIAAHRTTVREGLGDERYALLLARLDALAAVPSDDTMAVRRAYRYVCHVLLDLPYDHPVRDAVGALRLTAAPPGPRVAVGARELTALLSAPPSAQPGAALGTTDELLGAAALSADEVRARFGAEAPARGLIRLPDPVGGDRYPQFQFREDGGSPHEVVLEINRLLLADLDPWGAAAWWLSGNTWLGGTPASLLGQLPDERLVAAATALAEGD
ncbi:hypothetical protein OHB02_01645 [Streptomyces albidoflavus]|uniref:hypothetical protein n=1 Tax=Streptomyces TaxID=1883 RepID=UPI00053EC13E|nr:MULTISPECIES: hypothetical protein [unclassified Streptomyces]MBP3081238.1 hypothetical protein [Streptomyces sp. 604F]QHV83848.1 hypothetical protein C3K23_02550 [Streptomyces sp. 604F]WSB19008.1 hypothetical protein OHB02_01645 [Streptomyces albidoflavus]